MDGAPVYRLQLEWEGAEAAEGEEAPAEEEAEPEPEPEPEETPEEKEEMAQDILGQMADGIVAERERDAAAAGAHHFVGDVGGHIGDGLTALAVGVASLVDIVRERRVAEQARQLLSCGRRGF